MSHVSVYVFWGVVALLVLAAGWNHGWHHVRDSHLRARLTRASHREAGPLGRLVEVSAPAMSTPEQRARRIRPGA